MRTSITVLIILVFASCANERKAPQNALRSEGGQMIETASTSYEERQGKYIYEKYCAVCHGKEGKGDGFNAYNLDPKPRDFTDTTRMNGLSNERVLETISQGGRGVNKSALMPTWGSRLSKSEVDYVGSYIRRFSIMSPHLSEDRMSR